MSYCQYEVDQEKRVATVVFNRPEKLNAVTSGDAREMIDLLTDIEQDDRVAAVVFKGAGRAFGSGFDIDHVRTQRGFSDTSRRPSLRQRMQPAKINWWGSGGSLLQRIFTCDKVTIAQVHGYCYGLHFEIMTVCDLAIASEDATFTHPGWRYLGIEGHLPVYILMMGWRRVKEMMLLGKIFDAAEAKEFGMLTRVVPREKLEEETCKVAERAAQNPLDGIVAGKASFALAMDIMGASAGRNAARIAHAFMSNLRFEPGEFNLMRELGKKGRQGMYTARDNYFRESPVRRVQ